MRKLNYLKNLRTKNKIVNLLVFLMKSDGKLCLPKRFFPFDEKKLLTTVEINKAVPFLFHFTICSTCREQLNKKTIKKLNDYQNFATMWQLLYQDEKKSLGKYCQKEGIKAILIKDFSSYPKIKLYQKYLIGIDLDILVKKNDLSKIESFLKKRGYRLKRDLSLKNKRGKIYYQEKDFILPKKHTSLDIHTQIAIPHSDEFNFLSSKTMEDLTKTIFRNSRQPKQSNLYIPNKEIFLLSLIAHYQASDVLKGLRNFFDIIQFAHLYDKEIDWEKFLKFAARFQLTSFSYFILLSGSQIFEISFPENLKKREKIPFKARFLVPYLSAKKITFFLPITKWCEDNKEARKIFYENFFIKLLLVDSVPFWRLIRPRVFIFFLKVGVAWFNKLGCLLYQKLSLLKYN